MNDRDSRHHTGTGLLSGLAVVLVRPKQPENIGAAARAMANMGCEELILVAPRDMDARRAAQLATLHARHLSDSARICPDLASAVAGFSEVYGTTARLGGWRKGVFTARAAGEALGDKLARGLSCALVFGPEDKGMTNEEAALCRRLVTIPTAGSLTSLNLAQAVMVMLYECHLGLRAASGAGFTPKGPPRERVITHAEHETLMQAVQETLEGVDYFHDQNSDYWMQPLRRFFAKLEIQRNEFNLLMGICRQVRWIAGLARPRGDHGTGSGPKR